MSLAYRSLLKCNTRFDARFITTSIAKETGYQHDGPSRTNVGLVVAPFVAAEGVDNATPVATGKDREIIIKLHVY